MIDFKKIMPKALSALMSLTVLCSGIAVASYSAGAESTSPSVAADSKNTEEKTDNTKTGSNGKLSKTETVYVIADANGSPEKVIVSNWIKNPSKAQKITDKTNLKNVENVKGDETYTINEDKTYEWNANGSDIYYQGEGVTELPVGVTVSYTLDGKRVSPADLAGKSGRVTMRFDYTNRKYETVKIDGKDEKIYVPFIMLTGMLLDNDKFTNVEVENGKVINDGTRTYVAGFAMPGLQESLGLDTKDYSLPSYVEISADTTDFELATTLTVATNEVFSDIDTSKAEDEVKELEESVDKLCTAADELVSGTSELYEGVGTLLSKSGDLVDGVDSLYSGAQQLKSGTSALDSGAAELNDGVTELDSGIASLDSGAGKLKNGAGELSSGADSLDSGVNELQGYIAALSGGLETISGNSAQLTQGAKQVFETLLSTANTQIAAAGVTAPTLTIDNYSSTLSTIIASLDTDSAKQLAYDTAYKTVSATVNSQRDVIYQAVEAETKKQVTSAVLSAAGLSMSYDEYEAAVAGGLISEDVQAQISAAVAAQMTGMQGTIDAAVDAKIQELIESNMQSEDVQSQIAEGVAKVEAGRKSLESLKTQLDSYNTFYKGVLDYTAGVDQANSGAKEILSGTYTLKSGSGSLASGASSLKSGTDELKSGADKLKSGSGKLKSGAGKLSSGASAVDSGAGELYSGIGTLKESTPLLIDGIEQISDGSMQLDTGMKKFKTDGIDKIKSAVDTKLKPVVERLKQIKKVSDNYNSYSGAANGMDSSVDFIIKTDSVETDK